MIPHYEARFATQVQPTTGNDSAATAGYSPVAAFYARTPAGDSVSAGEQPLLEQTDLHEEIDAKETIDSESLDTREALEQKDMPEELPLDATWDEIYTAGTPSGMGNDYSDDELPVYQGETTQTLQDYLMWQVDLTRSQKLMPPLQHRSSMRLMKPVISLCHWKTFWKAWGMKTSHWTKLKLCSSGYNTLILLV